MNKRSYLIKKGAICGSSLLLAGGLYIDAQANELPTIVIKGQRFLPEQSGFTANVIDQEEIKARHITQMQELYREIPGMSVRNLGLGGVADNITMRGFAGGGHGGDIGVAIDGISLNEAMSHADGYADQNVIVPLEIERMTVFKGPSSSLYGSYNRGGTISFESRKDGDYREFDVKAGSFSTIDAQAALGMPISDSAQGNFAAQFYRTNGFREQSDTQRGTITGRIGFDLGNDTTLAFSGRAHQGKWDSAGYITEEQNDSPDRRFDKDPRVQNDGGNKDFYTGRVDLSTPLSSSVRLLAYAYGTKQTFSRIFTRPTSAQVWEQRLEDYDRNVLGAGASLNGLNQLANRDVNWIAGFEILDESTRYIYKDALHYRAETAATTGGGKPYLDREYGSRSFATYGQLEWDVSPWFRPIFGLRHEQLSGDCRANQNEIRADASPCHDMPQYRHFSPKIGIRSTWSPNVDTRVSYSEGFQLPPSAARYGVNGGSLEPTVLKQVEAGITLRPFNELWVDAAMFRIQSSNEVRDLGSGLYENFGRTRRQGIELDARYAVSKNLDIATQLTWLQTRVLESGNSDAVGRSVPGVPERTANLRGTYRLGGGWSADLALLYTSGYSIVADESASVDSYTTADAMVSYERKLAGVRQRFYLSVSNLFDRAYDANSFVMGGTQLYAPGAPRTIMLGLSLAL